ncbi:MAG: nucleoside 2-deoxyribosyltransferase [Anaerolineales bacterium]|jgi:nucleoside 2-deoxyribosyltransferase|nr:nucleoside 2-deoxyribosyltransferase [Anaerolineales bacterium]
MRIYFACSIVGGRQDEAIYRHIVQALLADGHTVPTAGNAGVLAAGEPGLEMDLAPQEVYSRDIGWIDDSDALIAEVSTPSHGVGYEIGYALEHQKPVLCIFRQGVRVSKMITGNTKPGLALADYADEQEAIEDVRNFLANLS